MQIKTDCERFDQLTVFFYSPDKFLDQDTVKFYLAHEKTCPKAEHNRAKFQERFGAPPEQLGELNVIANMQRRAKMRCRILSGVSATA